MLECRIFYRKSSEKYTLEIYGKVFFINRDLELIIKDKEFNKDLLKRERLIIVHKKEKDYKFK